MYLPQFETILASALDTLLSARVKTGQTSKEKIAIVKTSTQRSIMMSPLKPKNQQVQKHLKSTSATVKCDAKINIPTYIWQMKQISCPYRSGNSLL